MNYTKTINRRRVTSIALVAVMLFSMLAGTLAFFTDRAETQATATAGSVKIALDDSGINLKDADGKDIMNPGDARDFNYSVKNVGNKSIDVLETIVLSAYDKEGNPLNMADTQSEFEIYQASDVTYDATKGWIPNDGASPLTVKSLNGNVITYVRPAYALNGNSELDDDKREIEDGINTDIQSNEFKLIFKAASSNAFQGAILKADVTIEAKQHRNTEAVDWAELQTVTHVLSNGNQVVIVPGANDSVVVNPLEDFETENLGNNEIKITGVSDAGANKGTIVVPSTAYDAESDTTYTVTDVDWEQVFAGFSGNVIDNTNAPVQPSDDLVFDMNGNVVEGLTDNGSKLTKVEFPENVEVSEGAIDEVNNSTVIEDVVVPDSVDLPANAYFVYEIVDGTSVTITGLTELGTTLNPLVVPSEIEGLPVTNLNDGALNQTKATEMTIPESITWIGPFNAGPNVTTLNYNATHAENAHYKSGFGKVDGVSGSNITTLNIGENVEYIDKSAFDGMVNLKTVNYNAPNATTGSNNYYPAFGACSSLTEFNIGDNVTKIPDSLLYGVASLKTVEIPANLTNLTGAFQYTGLESIVIPATVTTIGDCAFAGCSSLKTITFEGETMPAISQAGGWWTSFGGCTAVTDIYINDAVTTIPDGYFDCFASVENITIHYAGTATGAPWGAHASTTVVAD